MAALGDVANGAIGGGLDGPALRRWETPRVIVADMSKAEFNSLAFVSDHSTLGGSASGTQTPS